MIILIILSLILQIIKSSNVTIQCIPNNCTSTLDYYSNQTLLLTYIPDRGNWIDSPSLVLDNGTYSPSTSYYNVPLLWPLNASFSELYFILSPAIQNVPKEQSNGGYLQVRISWKDKRLNDGFIVGANLRTGPLFELRNSRTTSTSFVAQLKTSTPKYVIGSNSTSYALDMYYLCPSFLILSTSLFLFWF